MLFLARVPSRADRLALSEERRRAELLDLTLHWPGCHDKLERSPLLLAGEGVARLVQSHRSPLGDIMVDTHTQMQLPRPRERPEGRQIALCGESCGVVPLEGYVQSPGGN